MKVLVAGVGNLLFGDEGFGLAVIERLASNRLPTGVRLMSAGIRGLDLGSALLDGYEGAILVDAMSRGGSPGTLYVLEPNERAAAAAGRLELDGDAHAFEQGRALGLARAAGSRLAWVRVVGCEPSPLTEMSMTLSPPVEAAVETAAELVTELLGELRETSVAYA
ncbi:MAG TPA: hydrogenase maturation protease [Polyangiaceae bacterium]|nr:hydrogenase maturation protease [Polyangiaceae bacterium]